MRLGYTRWAVLSEIVGESGTGGFVTMYVVFFVATMAPCGALLTGCLAAAKYMQKEREAEQSVNFITCHDGFTLNDLVSYNEKHNEANGEDNRDGGDDNRSWNWGVEGPTDDPAIEKLQESPG